MGEQMDVNHFVRHAFSEGVHDPDKVCAHHDAEFSLCVVTVREIMMRSADDEFNILGIRKVPMSKGLTLIEHGIAGPQYGRGEVHD
jgi:hypothetical protein